MAVVSAVQSAGSTDEGDGDIEACEGVDESELVFSGVEMSDTEDVVRGTQGGSSVGVGGCKDVLAGGEIDDVGGDEEALWVAAFLGDEVGFGLGVGEEDGGGFEQLLSAACEAGFDGEGGGFSFDGGSCEEAADDIFGIFAPEVSAGAVEDGMGARAAGFGPVDGGEGDGFLGV